jgi:hypothetical protein
MLNDCVADLDLTADYAVYVAKGIFTRRVAVSAKRTMRCVR